MSQSQQSARSGQSKTGVVHKVDRHSVNAKFANAPVKQDAPVNSIPPPVFKRNGSRLIAEVEFNPQQSEEQANSTGNVTIGTSRGSRRTPVFINIAGKIVPSICTVTWYVKGADLEKAQAALEAQGEESEDADGAESGQENAGN